MRFRFIGDPAHGGEGPDTLELFGLTFDRVGWTEAEGAVARKLARHSHFESAPDDGVPPEPEPAPKRRGRPPKAG